MLKASSRGMLCLFRGFALIWAGLVFCGSLSALCVPAQTSCGATAPRVSVGNGVNVLETRRNAAGVNSCQRELGKFPRGVGEVTQEERLFLSQSV